MSQLAQPQPSQHTNLHVDNCKINCENSDNNLDNLDNLDNLESYFQDYQASKASLQDHKNKHNKSNTCKSNSIISKPIGDNYLDLEYLNQDIEDFQDFDDFDEKNIPTYDENDTSLDNLFVDTVPAKLPTIHVADKDKAMCTHTSTTKIQDIVTCTICGLVLSHDLSTDQEWRYFGSSDSRHSSDPSRCTFRKHEDKSIFKELQKLDIPRNVMEDANILYFQITDGKIQRGNNRKAIVCACVFNSYKHYNNPQSPEVLHKKFGLTKKEMSKGLNFFNLHISKDRKSQYILVEHLIPQVLALFSASQEHVDQVMQLYLKVKDRSNALNRSNPRSTVAGLIFYYCRSIGKNVPCGKFAAKVGLSMITIYRIAKIIAEILHTNEIKLN